MWRSPKWPLLLTGFVLVCTGMACDRTPPEEAQLKTQVDYLISPSTSDDTVKSRLIDSIDGADQRVWAAVAGDVVDAEMAEALVSAHDREGVDVQLVADVDQKGTEHFKKLQEAGLPITWGDGDLSYLPVPNITTITAQCKRRDKRFDVVCTAGDTTSSPCNDRTVRGGQGTVCRPGDFNLMSHRFFIVDERTVWNLAGGFDTGEAGNLGWKIDSEYVRQDFVREFRQLRGGVFATELDAYNGPVKSGTNATTDYDTDQGVLRIRFNPQERLMKQIIDQVYRAKDSVKVTTSMLRNPFLLDALEYKATNGFDVEIVVGQGAQPNGSAKQRLRDLNAKAHPAGRGLPSVVVIDGESQKWPRVGMALSHPMWHGKPFDVVPPTNPQSEDASDRVRVYPSDSFVDGNLWVLREFSSNTQEIPPLNQLSAFVDRAINQASSL